MQPDQPNTGQPPTYSGQQPPYANQPPPYANQPPPYMNQPASTPQPPPYGPPPGAYPYPYVVPQPNAPSAIVALIFAITGFIGLGFIGGILAIVFGNKTKQEIAQSGGRLGGGDMARISIILGWISIGLTVAIFAFILLFFFGIAATIFSTVPQTIQTPTP